MFHCFASLLTHHSLCTFGGLICPFLPIHSIDSLCTTSATTVSLFTSPAIGPNDILLPASITVTVASQSAVLPFSRSRSLSLSSIVPAQTVTAVKLLI